MPVRKALILLASIAALLAITVVPASGRLPLTGGHPRIVSVKDDFFTPTAITVARQKLVKWVWSAANTDSHNVALTSGPRGVKKTDFKSSTGAVGVRFERRLNVAGTYKFICTLHPTVMKLTITVQR